MSTKLSDELYGYNNTNTNEHIKYIVEHYADRPSVMAAISRLNYEKNQNLIDEALNTLITSDANNQPLVDKYRKDQKEQKELKERMKVGAKVPELSFLNTKGKTKNISDYEGKILVLDFWASWCGPCRAEIPNLKQFYSEFDKKKVEFLSISIDAKKAAWVKALNVENMPWQQGWCKDAGKEAMKTCQFSGIPFILVIDKDGTIYRKDVRGEEIRNAVQDCLDGKPYDAPKTVITTGSMMMGM